MSERLAHDHAALNGLLSELCLALESGEVQQIHSRLDLFWARLAMHIRAEHLELFPAILRSLRGDLKHTGSAPALTVVQNSIKELRLDHDFFMHELAGAIKTVRGFGQTTERQFVDKQLEDVRTRIAAVEERLSPHNKLEEEGVYLWIGELLSNAEQSELAARLREELEKMPPRFVYASLAED